MVELTPGRRRSRWPQFCQERLDGPGRTSASEEVVVTGQDRGVEREGKRHRRPIGRITWYPSSSGVCHVLVEPPRHDVDRIAVDEGMNDLDQAPTLLDRQAALSDDRRDARVEFVASLFPLVFGHQTLKLGACKCWTPL